MAKVMLVSSRVEEIKGAVQASASQRQAGQANYGGWFLRPAGTGSDQGISRKPEKIKPEGTGKRGRPRSHEELRPMFAECLRERGLVATQKWLANGGFPLA